MKEECERQRTTLYYCINERNSTQRQDKVRNVEKSQQCRAQSVTSSSPRGRRGAVERRYDRVPMIPLRICPPFCTFLPRKRYWPPLQSPPTSNIQECWFSSVLFANFYDCPRNNYRNDFPKFRSLISMHIHYTLYFTRENTYSLTTIVFNACLEKQSLKLAPNWMQVQTRSSLVICSIVN